MASIATRVITGVSVPDTPLINKALVLAEAKLDQVSYNHVVRSWLCGHYISSNVSQFEGRDSELCALAAILHDMGWAFQTSELISKDNGFGGRWCERITGVCQEI